MATVRELITKFGLEFDQTQANKADQAINSLKSAARGLASAFAVIKVTSFLKDSVMAASGLADSLQEASERTGVTTQALQELGFAAKQTGVETADLETGLRFLSKNMAAAQGGSKDMQAAFAQLGVSIVDSNGKLRATDQVLTDAADKFALMENGAKKSALAQEIFGKGGTKLIPLLNQGSAGLRKQRLEAQALGIVLGDDAVKAGAEFQDKMDVLGMTLHGIKVAIGGELIPVISDMVKGFLGWFKANREEIQGNLVRILTVVGTVIKGIVGGIKALVGTIMEIGRSIASLGPVLKTLIAIGLAIAGIFLLPELAIAAMVALLFLVIDDIVNFFQGNKSVIGELIESIKFVFMEAFNGIRDFFKGFIREIVDGWAMAVDALSIKIEEGVNKIKSIFTDLWEHVKIIFSNIAQSVAETPIISGISKFLGFSGGAASPEASAKPNAISNAVSNRSVGNMSNTNNISITQQPGQSATDVANEVAIAIEERNQAAYRAALDQLTYGVSQ